MKHLFMFVIVMCFAHGYAQQHYTGISQDNSIGMPGVYSQPASIVNSRAKLSLSFSSVQLSTTNYEPRNFNNLVGFIGNQSTGYRNHKLGGYKINNNSMDLLGAKYELDHNNAIGYSFRLRSFNIKNGLPSTWTEADANNYLEVGTEPFALEKLSFQKLTYFEHSFNYGGVLLNRGDDFWKMGMAVKLINGVSGSYLFTEEGEMQFLSPTSSTAEIRNTEFQFGKSDDMRELDTRHLGGGMSIGLVYEYRPNRGRYKYDMDGKTGIERYDVNKYKCKFGLSLTDLGWVRFTKDSSSYNFDVSANQVDVRPYTDAFTNLYDATSNQLLPLSDSAVDQSEKFSMGLPASLNLQFDYEVTKNLYANISTATPLRLPGDPSRIYQKSIYSLTPRYESTRFAAMLPISLQASGQVNVGAAVRMQLRGMTAFFGSNNISFLVLGKRKIYTANLFGGVAYNIFYKIPADRDEDKVSDKVDDCMYDPGPWELKGCPDTDEDGIPDKEDLCIYDKGSKKLGGCPDADEDGVIDLNDQCPQDAGLAVHYGCPDRDFDGVIDVADRCPDEAGIELNNGCPFDNRSCCVEDGDGDGVGDAVDQCPDVQGSVYNMGCPIDSSNIDKINFDQAKVELDPNNTIDKVDEIEAQPNSATMIVSGEEPEELNRENFKLYSLNIYFDFDDATIDKKYQSEMDKILESVVASNKGAKFVIVGHTDNDGSENYNLILSRKRSEVVRRTLVNRGIPEKNIAVYYYGEWKPLRSNENESGKQYNRRVEVQIMKK